MASKKRVLRPTDRLNRDQLLQEAGKMGLPQNLWVKKLGLCPRPQDFQGMAPVSQGG